MRLLSALTIVIGLSPCAFASEGFDLVIPGRPGVPIIVFGIDVSYAVIESDYGLGKGSYPQPTIFGGRLVDPVPNVGHYYPSLGLRPGYGRLEIEPPANRKLPQPAESFHQNWSAQSAPLPPTSTPEVPMYPPPVILAPRDDDWHREFSTPPQNFRRGP